MTIVIIAIYTIVVLSIAVVRVTSSLGDDAAPVEVMARTTVMLVATLGPPWLAEWLVRRRTPAIVARKRLKILRSRLRVALRARTRAEGAVNQIVRGAEHWDREHARRKALYEVEHRLEVAKVSTERGMP